VGGATLIQRTQKSLLGWGARSAPPCRLALGPRVAALNASSKQGDQGAALAGKPTFRVRDNLNHLIYLGRPIYQPVPHTRIEPIAVAENGGWRTYSDWVQAMPNEGRVFCPRLLGFDADDLVVFHVAPNPRGPQDKDQLVVSEPRHPWEVFDFRRAPAEIVRQRLVERGISRILPGAEFVVAALGNGACAVLKMVPHPVSDRWVAAIEGLEQLEIHAFDERLFDGDRIEGRWISVPGSSVGSALGSVNWCRDADFLEGVLKRLRKIQGAGGLTRAQISQVVLQLDRAELMPASGADLDPTVARLGEFLPKLNSNLKNVDEIVAFLSEVGLVQKRLEMEVESRRESLEAEIRNEVESRVLHELDETLAELRTERDLLIEETAGLRRTAIEVNADVEEKRRSLETTRFGLAEEFVLMLSELNDAHPDANEPLNALAARLTSKLGEFGSAFEIAAHRGPPWSTPRFINADLKPWSEFHQNLNAMALRWGYASDDLQLADAAVRAGNLIILPEETGAQFVGCYADAITGGGFARHTLDPSVISVDDLWRQPSSNQVTTFARAWAASKLIATRYHIVLLDGLHRTPTSLWLPSFLEIIKDDRRPDNLLIFATTGGDFVDPDRVWYDAAGSVPALVPQIAQTSSPRILARAAGIIQPASYLNALEAPIPQAADVLSFLTDIGPNVSSTSLEIAIAVYRATFVLGAERAAGLARAIARLDDNSLLATGTGWLAKQLKK
jgi:hypothetical protein